jgi:hypothetical protein
VFDGADDYVLVSDDPSLNPTSAISISFWMKTPTTSSIGRFVVNKMVHNTGTAADDSYGMRIHSTTGAPAMQIAGGGNNWAWIESSQAVTDGEWHHVAFVFNKPTSYFYIDGVYDDNGTYPSFDHDLNNTAENVYLGAGNNNGTIMNFFDGSLDDITIWDRALTQEEIQSNMSTPPTGSEPGLVGYWNFNEGTGTSLVDQTSDGNDGTIYGATWSDDVPPTPGEVSDNDILIETHTLQFTQYNALVSSQLEADKDYYLKITGTFNVHSCCAQFDAAYEFIDSDPPSPTRDKWFWNSLTNQRPYPDQYNSDHVYYFYFTSDGTTEEFGFEDGAYGDNSGSLTIQIWQRAEEATSTTNYSLSFDGVDDYVSLGNPSDFDYLLNSDYSISFDFKGSSEFSN